MPEFEHWRSRACRSFEVRGFECPGYSQRVLIEPENHHTRLALDSGNGATLAYSLSSNGSLTAAQNHDGTHDKFRDGGCESAWVEQY